MFKRVFLFLAFTFAIAATSGAAASDERLLPIGEFGALARHGEECNGSVLRLWRRSEQWYGVLEKCEGLIDAKVDLIFSRSAPEKTPTLDNLRYSAGTDILPSGQEKAAEYVLSIALALDEKSAKLVTRSINAKTVTEAKLHRQKTKIKSFDSAQQFLKYQKSRFPTAVQDGEFGP